MTARPTITGSCPAVLEHEYGPDYYAVIIRDPAGNNLELKCQADVAG